MNDFDEFCNELFEQAKRFYELSKDSKSTIEGKKAFNNASLLLGICALEAYINGISDEMLMADGYSIQIRSALLERDIKLKNGEFILGTSLKMSRLIDRIEIIHRVHTQKPLPDDESWCKDLKHAIDLRNQIVHPKDAIAVEIVTVERSLKAINGCLSVLYKAVYKAKFPRESSELISKLTF